MHCVDCACGSDEGENRFVYDEEDGCEPKEATGPLAFGSVESTDCGSGAVTVLRHGGGTTSSHRVSKQEEERRVRLYVGRVCGCGAVTEAEAEE